MLIEKYVNVVLSKEEYELIAEVAREQNLNERIVMREIFQAGLDEMKYYRTHEMRRVNYENNQE